MPPLRIIFMGTPQFACPTLQMLIDRGEKVVAAVTQPDRPKGRGQQMQQPPVKVLAEQHGIPVLQPQKVRASEAIEEIRACSPDLIVVIAFGQILPNLVSAITVVATLQIAQVIILESFLSFLGLGIQPPTPAWGNMLGEGRVYMLNS